MSASMVSSGASPAVSAAIRAEESSLLRGGMHRHLRDLETDAERIALVAHHELEHGAAVERPVGASGNRAAPARGGQQRAEQTILAAALDRVGRCRGSGAAQQRDQADRAIEPL